MSYDGVFEFYRDRVNACPFYGFRAGHDLLKLVIRTAFHDSMLTDDEFNNILNLAEKAHIKMMEDNYNAGFKQ